MAYTKNRTSGRTITKSVEVEVDVDLAVESDDIERWLDGATDEELDALGIRFKDESDDLPGYPIRVNCGADSGSQFDLAQIQELMGQMHVQDILDKLRA